MHIYLGAEPEWGGLGFSEDDKSGILKKQDVRVLTWGQEAMASTVQHGTESLGSIQGGQSTFSLSRSTATWVLSSSYYFMACMSSQKGEFSTMADLFWIVAMVLLCYRLLIYWPAIITLSKHSKDLEFWIIVAVGCYSGARSCLIWHLFPVVRTVPVLAVLNAGCDAAD
jgi:hypothetical protein